MKALIPRTTEENITHIALACAVNYEEEEIPNDFPGRDGEMWRAKINLDTGTVEDWPAGKEFDLHPDRFQQPGIRRRAGYCLPQGRR